MDGNRKEPPKHEHVGIYACDETGFVGTDMSVRKPSIRSARTLGK